MLGNDDLSLHGTYETPSSELGKIALQHSTDRWDGCISDTVSGSQFLPLFFGELIIASKVIEVRKDGFYYDV
jgi:hypothetical protein